MNKIFFMLFFIFFPGISFSLNYESQDELKSMASHFIMSHMPIEQGESLEVGIRLSDVPNKLEKCSKQIDIKFPSNIGRDRINSIEMACDGDHAWHVFVPVNIQILTKVVVTKHPIAANDILSENDLDYSQVDVSHLYSGYFNDIAQLKGYIASQMLETGSVVSKKNIRKPQLIHKNQEIALVARKNSIEVTMKGISKSDGCLNDSIIAYNPSSKKTLEAVVIGFNKAEVIS